MTVWREAQPGAACVTTEVKSPSWLPRSSCTAFRCVWAFGPINETWNSRARQPGAEQGGEAFIGTACGDLGANGGEVEGIAAFVLQPEMGERGVLVDGDVEDRVVPIDPLPRRVLDQCQFGAGGERDAVTQVQGGRHIRIGAGNQQDGAGVNAFGNGERHPVMSLDGVDLGKRVQQAFGDGYEGAQESRRRGGFGVIDAVDEDQTRQAEIRQVCRRPGWRGGREADRLQGAEIGVAPGL